METLRTLALIIVVAAIAFGIILISQNRGGLPDAWEVNLSDPILIGDASDRFAYAGGPSILPVEGSGKLKLTDGEGSIELRFTPSTDGSDWIGPVTIRASIETPGTIEIDALINGETGRGEPLLPETYAYVFGTSRFTIHSGAQGTRNMEGFWSLAHALRRGDGSIRNQGLIYSPLLRDKSIFSDPERLEFTLILYEEDEVILDLVYRSVEIVRFPPSEDLP